MAKPFCGLRVVDFTQVISGPFATYQLAAMGADVVKVEQPKGGDQGRYMVAPTAQSKSVGMSALYTTVNGGKRSLTLDLKHPGAAAVVHTLVSAADVVVENFKAGTMKKLGFDYPALKQLKPDLVYCSISGFGQSGPRASAAAYDPVVQAASGMMAVTGHPESGPTKVGFWVSDMTAGLNAAFAIAGALFRRSCSGEGSYIDVSMLDTSVSMMSPLLSMFMNYGVEPPLTGNGSPGSGGTSTVYPTADGFLTVAAVTDAQFAKMALELGLPDVAIDPRFSSREDRIANGEAYRALVVPAFAKDSALSWQARLATVGVPACKNLTIPEVVGDAQLAHRNVFQSLPAPSGLEGPFTAVSLGFHLGQVGLSVGRPPPGIGEHSDAVLAEIGYDDAAILELRRDGVV